MFKIGLVILALIAMVGTTTHYAFASDTSVVPLCSTDNMNGNGNSNSPSGGDNSNSNGNGNSNSPSGEMGSMSGPSEYGPEGHYYGNYHHPFISDLHRLYPGAIDLTHHGIYGFSGEHHGEKHRSWNYENLHENDLGPFDLLHYRLPGYAGWENNGR